MKNFITPLVAASLTWFSPTAAYSAPETYYLSGQTFGASDHGMEWGNYVRVNAYVDGTLVNVDYDLGYTQRSSSATVIVDAGTLQTSVSAISGFAARSTFTTITLPNNPLLYPTAPSFSINYAIDWQSTQGTSVSALDPVNLYFLMDTMLGSGNIRSNVVRNGVMTSTEVQYDFHTTYDGTAIQRYNLDNYPASLVMNVGWDGHGDSAIRVRLDDTTPILIYSGTENGHLVELKLIPCGNTSNNHLSTAALLYGDYSGTQTAPVAPQTPTLDTVPEPSLVTLLGLAGFIFFLRRRIRMQHV